MVSGQATMRLETSDGQTKMLRCAGECARGRRGRTPMHLMMHDSTAPRARALVQGALLSPCETVHCRSTAVMHHHHRGREDMRVRTTSLKISGTKLACIAISFALLGPLHTHLHACSITATSNSQSVETQTWWPPLGIGCK